jgi:RimJ/RimL family protein N-acetyltransferase
MDAGFTELTTQRLVLRRFRPEDLDAFAVYRSDPQIARYQSWVAPYPASQAREFLRELDRNTRSVAVLERVGMRREGHLLESTWAKGEWTSDLLYAVLGREWPAGR